MPTNDPPQSEVDAVALAIAIDMRECGGPSNSDDVAKWPGVQRGARAAILALDRVRAGQHEGDCPNCTWMVKFCPVCFGTGKRAPDVKEESNG